MSLFEKVEDSVIGKLLALTGRNSVKKKFTEIYANNSFLGAESRSGEGSSLAQTRVIRQELPKLLRELHVTSMLDAPCGDFNWIKEMELPASKYIGIDIVEEIIEHNQKTYGNQERSFTALNIIEDELPRTDIILCRDCLVHLSCNQGIRTIMNFKKSGSKYLLTTTFTDRKTNSDLGKSIWRTLNLEVPPFSFPKPLKIINEHCTEGNGEYTDKALGLWLLDEIKY